MKVYGTEQCKKDLHACEHGCCTLKKNPVHRYPNPRKALDSRNRSRARRLAKKEILDSLDE